MNNLHQEMVDTCERLLNLLTGRAPIRGEDAEAALCAIELLSQLESYLRISAEAPLPTDAQEAIDSLAGRLKVIAYLEPVLTILVANGQLRPASVGLVA